MRRVVVRLGRLVLVAVGVLRSMSVCVPYEKKRVSLTLCMRLIACKGGRGEGGGWSCGTSHAGEAAKATEAAEAVRLRCLQLRRHNPISNPHPPEGGQIVSRPATCCAVRSPCPASECSRARLGWCQRAKDARRDSLDDVPWDTLAPTLAVAVLTHKGEEPALHLLYSRERWHVAEARIDAEPKHTRTFLAAEHRRPKVEV